MNKKFNILYVDDEISNLNIFKNTFRRDYCIFIAESAQMGLEILEKENIDLILTDQRMPEMSGVEFLKNAMLKHPHPSRILITAYTDFDALKDAVNEAKIFQFIQKPWEEKEIQKIIDNALEIYQLKQKNIELTHKLKVKNEELLRLNTELVELDKLKYQFLNIISHEIRTPLNGLMGITMLIKSELAESELGKMQELVHILELSTQRLEHFLLLAERITAFKARKYKISPDSFKIDNIVYDILKVLNDKILKKNIVVKFENSGHPSGEWYADKHLIEFCIREIIDNAIKHSHQNGKIFIQTFSPNNNLIIEVIDEGPGFAENVLNHLYKPFITDEDITKQGMGLDLALIKLIIEVHGGTIEIKNNTPHGATVRIELNNLEDISEELAKNATGNDFSHI